MAGGPMVTAGGEGNPEQYKGGLTWQVAVTCVLAASGGLLFGYDTGISGGVLSMHPFLGRFFPDVLKAELSQNSTSPYCKYDNQLLQLFVSSLYLAGAASAIVGTRVTSRYGRKTSMIVAGALFLVGALLQCTAYKVAQLVIGRVVLGFGVGFANQSVPVFLSEVAPYKLRGAMNIMFQLAVTIGIFVAQLINYGIKDIQWAWRLSLGLAGVPALIMLLGGLIVYDSPNALIERGKEAKALKVLKTIRGVDDVEEEFDDIKAAALSAQKVPNPWKTILQRRYRPQLVIAILIPIFQQLSGINAIMFYAPQLFGTIFGPDASLLNTVIIGAVNVGSTVVAIVTVDHFGRRFLFIEGGIQAFIMQVLVAGVLGHLFATYGTNIPTGPAQAIVAFICIYVAGFAWSWGPLGWLVPSEIQPLETRSAGLGITVFFNFILTFLIGQVFLSMLCSMEWGTFVFFAAWILIMTLFVIFFVPETKNLPIEEVPILFAKHWFWKRYTLSNVPEGREVSIGAMHISGGKAELDISRRASSRNMSKSEAGMMRSKLDTYAE